MDLFRGKGPWTRDSGSFPLAYGHVMHHQERTNIIFHCTFYNHILFLFQLNQIKVLSDKSAPGSNRPSINEMWHLAAQPGILETFLALHFRPSDSHCVHIDAGASDKTRAAMEGVFKCYAEKYPESNLFSIRFPLKVFWGHPTVLEVLNVKVFRLKGGPWVA